MANSLGWDGDDVLDFCDTFADLYGFPIPDEKSVRFETVGELYRWMVGKIPATGENQKCATQMAFHQIKVQLHDLRDNTKLRPSTELCEIPRSLLRAVRWPWVGALRLPFTRPKGSVKIAGRIAYISGIAFVTLLLISLDKLEDAPIVWLAGSLAIFVGALVTCLKLGPLIPEGMRTLGDLAKTLAAYNYGPLMRLGARRSDKELWCSLREVLAEHGNLSKDQITCDTVFADR